MNPAGGPTTVGLEREKYRGGLRRALAARYARVLRATVDGLGAANVLDYGTGTGELWGLADGRMLPAAAVDEDRDCLRANTLPPGRLVCARAEQPPFRPGSFDLVVTVEMLEHAARPDELLAELTALARRYVLVGVPHEPWFRLACLAGGRYLATLGNSPNHRQQFTASAFAALLARHGRVVTVTHVLPWQFGVIAVD